MILRLRHTVRGTALLLLAWSGAAGLTSAHAQGLPSDHVKWTVEAKPAEAAPGDLVRLQFHAEIGDGWKMYALDSPRPTRGVKVEFDTAAVSPRLEGAVRQAEPKTGFDPNFDMEVRYFEEEADLFADIRVPETATGGSAAATGRITFMICNERLCLPPTKVPFSAPITVAASGSGSDAPPAQQPEAAADPATALATDSLSMADTSSVPGVEAGGGARQAGWVSAGADLEAARSGGLWRFLLLAVGAGLAALLTPCVFPMIPLTVSFFTRHGEDRGAAVRMAGVYGVAIVLTFTALGLLAALLLGAAGAQTIAANPWLNLFVGAVFVVFALSLLGLFELRLPAGLVNYFNRQGNERGGYAGVLFMGLTLTLVSFSCTAPFVGGLLAATAHGERAYPILGMLAFSLTFALPFVVFALFPRALNALPRSGAWMNAVKVVLGFVELAAALKFFSNADLIWGWGLVSRPLAIALSAVIFFMAGLYLLGKLPLKHEPAPAQVGVGRLLAAIAFFGLSLYMMPGLLGAPLNRLDAYLPPRQATDVNLFAGGGGQNLAVALPDEEAWITDDVEAAFARAAETGKPVFIDFTGYTCTNCREMESTVFLHPEVADRFRRDFVLLRLYTDGLERGPDFQRFQLETTGTVALPTYAVVDPAARRVVARITGLTPADEFIAFLEEGAAGFRNRSLAGVR